MDLVQALVIVTGGSMKLIKDCPPMLLAVESDAGVRSALQRVLGDIYRVVTVGSAAEAAGIVALGVIPDVILSESALPSLPRRLQPRIVRFDKPGDIEQIEAELVVVVRFIRAERRRQTKVA